MNFCGKCGTPLQNNYKFCKNCGNPIPNTNDSFSKSKEVDVTNASSTCNSNLDTEPLDIASIDECAKLDNSLITPVVVSTSTKNTKSYDKNLRNDINSEEDDDDDDDDFDDEKSHLKPIILSIFIVAIITLGFFFTKDYIFCAYFNHKAKSSENVSTKVESYCKAYDFKSNNKTVDELFNVLISSSTLDDDLLTVRSYFSEKDYNDLSNRVYIYKAEQCFENDDLELCEKYLAKAEKNGYNLSDFKYYSNLNPKNANSNTKENNDYSSKNTPANSVENEYLISDSDTRLLSEKELSSYSKDDLAIIRNEIFARHGYVFQTEPFVGYFNSKSWYKPNSNFKGTLNELNSVEKANVELIQKLEK